MKKVVFTMPNCNKNGSDREVYGLLETMPWKCLGKCMGLLEAMLIRYVMTSSKQICFYLFQ